MKTPLLLCLLILGLVASCSRQTASLPGCIRFTEIDATRYRLEAGTLTTTGFVRTNVEEYAYSQNLHLRSELKPVLGKTLVALSLWEALPSPIEYRRSADTWTIQGVPVVAVDCL